MLALAVLVLAAAVGAAAGGAGTPGLGRGFGDKVEWHSLEDGLKLAKELNKPAMVLIHKSWCGACKSLGAAVSVSDEVAAASSDFVCINVQDNEEPADPKYKPDGGYIPRVLFLEADGTVRAELKNPQGNPKYAYFYSSPSQLVAGMEAAKAALGTQA
eukprot:TRINITY_DN585_c0_g1_i2.p2 TRINITY_DN585_c0_g1~~TRINITY_DN585_c0_g1_i2.p2  ORF type:complete len:165 (+),score=50.37 TRINITY_DN585_c0_g1_i2:24-497(+)